MRALARFLDWLRPRPATEGERALAEGGDEMLDRMRGLGMDRDTIRFTERCIKDARRRVNRQTARNDKALHRARRK